MRPLIFVSHLSQDTKLAVKLKESISGLLLGGVDFFVSSDGVSLLVGDNWLNTIQAKLLDAKLILVLCNSRSIHKPWINFEAGGGWMHKTRVIPLCFDGVTKSNLPAPLSHLQSVDLFDPVDFANLLEMVSRVAGLRNPEFNAQDYVAKLKATIQKDQEECAAVERDKVLEAINIASRYIGREVDPKDRIGVLKQVKIAVAPLRQLQQRLKDWGENSDDWIRDFHAQIMDYSRIFAVDVSDRSSIGSPHFERYLRKQYNSKLDASKKRALPS